MKTTTKKPLLFLLIIISNLPLLGCGRSYHIKGIVVFAEQDEISDGRIHEITGEPFPQGGKPVIGARIVMTYELDKQDKPVVGTIWQRDDKTDSDGCFDIKDYGPPFKQKKVGLEVNKEGFKTAYATYIDFSDKEPQVFYVVLVKERL